MKLARSLSVFLALAMLLCIFSACKKKEDEQQAGGEPQTLSKADLFTESGASYTFTCSIDGNVATILMADANDPDWTNRIEIAFDQNGNATEDIYNDEGAVIRHVEYNEAGKDTLLIWYDGEGNMYFRQESTYDENGNLTVKKGADFRLGNVVESHLEYEYDANGNEIKRTSYDAGKVKSVTEYEYDANGNETKEIVNGAVFSEHV